MNNDDTMKTLGCQQTVGEDNINAFVRSEDTKEISFQFQKLKGKKGNAKILERINTERKTIP